MTTVGTCVVERVPGGVRVLRADPFIRISRELLDAAATDNDSAVTVDDGVFTIHANPPVRYRVFDDGNPRDVPASLLADPA